jgi:hypothetical protein
MREIRVSDPPVVFSDQAAVLTSGDGTIQIVFTAETADAVQTAAPTIKRMVVARVKLPRDIAASLAANLPQIDPNAPIARAN